MRKAILASILILLLLATSSPTAEDNKPVIFFNTNVYAPWITATNQGYAEFATMLRNNGFTVNHGKLRKITEKFLEDVDIFVLAMPNWNLTDDDKQALRSWISKGGGLLVIGYPDVYDNSSIGQFAWEYGIRFGPRQYRLWSAQIQQDSPLAKPEPVYSVGRSFGVAWIIFLRIDELLAEPVAITQNDDIAIALSTSPDLGAGRLVMLGSPFLWYRYYGVNYIAEYDNRMFGLNVMKYLAHQDVDLMIKKTKVKGRRIIPGDVVKIVTKIKNLGYGDSTLANITHVLTEFSQVKGGPGDEIGTLGTNTLQSIRANKKTKMITVVQIPSNLTPGEYVVITTINAKDSNAENNIKASKTFDVN
jgi:hypothetical protein